MSKEEKIEAIAEILDQQKSLLKRFSNIGKLPKAKRINTVTKRLTEMISIYTQINSLEMQKYIIVAQPYQKIKEAGISNASFSKAYIDEAEEEIILRS